MERWYGNNLNIPDTSSPSPHALPLTNEEQQLKRSKKVGTLATTSSSDTLSYLSAGGSRSFWMRIAKEILLKAAFSWTGPCEGEPIVCIYDAQALGSSGFVVSNFKNIISTPEELFGITIVDSTNNIICRFLGKGERL